MTETVRVPGRPDGAADHSFPDAHDGRNHPGRLRERLQRLAWQLEDRKKKLELIRVDLQRLREYLELAPEVSSALQSLGAELFEQDLKLLEEKLTIALQEVLQQPIRFRATAEFRAGMASVDFSIERDGHKEDVRRGQGGSVHNVLSVGLRMFALTMLDPKRHRRFLMLDEQDCWLRPDLIPHLVKIVHEAGERLGYQVIMISHHDLQLFERYADRIYRFEPAAGAVEVRLLNPPGQAPDLGAG